MQKTKKINFNIKISLLVISALVFFFGVLGVARADFNYWDYSLGAWQTVRMPTVSPLSIGPATNISISCGADYCAEWGANYCSGNSVYQQRTCSHKTMSDNICYTTSSFTDTRLALSCGANQTCQNGSCVNSYVDTCQCSAGACCDGCHYKSAALTCNSETQTEYSCFWGSACGADVAKRTKTRLQYCSGNSSQCAGQWGDWATLSGWTVADNCTANEVCSSGASQCQASSACRPAYTQHYRKTCSDNDLYWFDSNGAKQDLAQSCNDNNECTKDSCQNSQCLNEPIDGCPGELVVVIAGRNEKTPLKWVRDIQLNPGEKVDFLMVVKNTGLKADNVVAQSDIPAEIVYKGNLKVDGNPHTGDIRNGIDLGSIEQKGVRLITFQGQIAPNNQIKDQTTEITGTAKTANFSETDSMKLAFSKTSFNLAAIGAAIVSLFTTGFWVPLLFSLLLIFIIYKTAKVWFFAK